MATIRTGMESLDYFSAVLYRITRAVNASSVAMEEIRQSMSSDLDRIETIRLRIPVEWETDPMPAFTETGIEQFAREIQNADQMLGQLTDTQETVARQAENLLIFPPESVRDLDLMVSRIGTIGGQLSALGQGFPDLGLNTVSADMECFREQISAAVREQEALNRAIGSMDIEQMDQTYQRLSGTITDVGQQYQGSKKEKELPVIGGSERRIKSVIDTYLSIQNLQRVLSVSDDLAVSREKLNRTNDGIRPMEDLQDMIFLSAQRSGGSYLNMADMVTDFGSLPGNTFGSTEEVIAFSEQFTKHFVIAGASATEMQHASGQLSRALATGALRGDQLNGIFEQTPVVIQAIADYMGVPMEELASRGTITADTIKNAMFAVAEETNARFEDMPMTFERIGQSFRNTALMAFEPVLIRLNELAGSEGFRQMADNLIQGFVFLANVVIGVLDLMVTAAETIVNSWWLIGVVISGVTTALLFYIVVMKGYNAIQKVSNALTALGVLRENTYAAALMLKSGATFMATAAQRGFNAALLACPVTWIILGIIALITVILAVIGAMNKFGDESTSVSERICGTLAVAAAFIGNLFISVINFIIEDFVNLWNFVALFANFFANVFTDPVGAAARLFFGFVDLALAGIQALASAVDTLFKTDLAKEAEAWRTNLDGWVAERFGEGSVVMEKKNAQEYYLEGFDYGQAWEKGAAFGIDKMPDAVQYGDFDYSSYLADIAGDTEDIRDGLGITNEDLRYLRDIAEQEAVNRFTTASINIEQTNHNNVSGGMDLDGVVIGLTDAVSEAASIMAEGVYA